MRRCYFYAAAFALVILLAPSFISARNIISRSSISSFGDRHDAMGNRKEDGREVVVGKRTRGEEYTFKVAGSRLPDCSRACGSCSPCRLVMVSFVCSSLQEAETCPMAYKCMCHNKSYPVP